ncbi:MAG: ABC transporter ATP-binding protein [Firmicutes bacterium]|nr:ABC transporter ATP-binding protein [Bacillota bacterium]
MDQLRVEHLNKIFKSKQGEVTALQDICFSVRKSEFVVIVGPSGCGKSTLINIIGGLEERSSGSVQIEGKDVEGPGADRGMVFQGYSLFPWLDVQKNVEFGLKMKGVSKAERAQTAQRYIEMVGLENFAHAMPDQLSGGMKQRVAIARTLANEPEILLMDEPFGALDAQTRVVMQESLADISAKTGSTILFITHDIDEAILLGDRILVMSKRPGTIRDEIEVTLSCARDHSALTDPGFLEIKKRIMDMLWEEMNLSR